MALLLETTLGDLVIDLDVEGSPELCKNVLKLAKARYYTSTLVYNVQPNRFCQLGDPQGDGAGGACIHGLIKTVSDSEDGKLDNAKLLRSQQRFLRSNMGRPLSKVECQQKGRVVATEMRGILDTIGSQLLITTCEGEYMGLDGYRVNTSTPGAEGEETPSFRSVGMVREDESNILDQIAATYCDASGRPYADIRVIRALVVDDPFDDPPGMAQLLRERGVIFDNADERVLSSPDYERPPEENVEIRIQADQVDPVTGEEDLERLRAQEEEILKREDKSRAVVLEMLGDLPDADATAPENVLFVCKLNPVTEDEDLELIFSRFDEQVKAEIIRDQDTGNSLQYAFVEFTEKAQAVEAYFKMNNALVDDRRIKVDFSQSVAKVWNKFSQRSRNSSGKRSNLGMPKNPFADSQSKHRNRGHGPPGDGARRHRDQGRDQRRVNPSNPHRRNGNGDRGEARGGRLDPHPSDVRPNQEEKVEFDQFGRRRPPQGDRPRKANHHSPIKNERHSRDHKGTRRRHDSEDESQYRNERRKSGRSRSQSRSRSADRDDRRHRKSKKHHKEDRHRERGSDKHERERKSDRRSRRHDSEESYDRNRSRRKRSRERHGSDDQDSYRDRKKRSKDEERRRERHGDDRRLRDDRGPSRRHEREESGRNKRR